MNRDPLVQRRKKRMSALWGLLGLGLFFYGMICPLEAQTTQVSTAALGSLNFFNEADLPARAAVMGPAFTAVADDASAVFFNPAGLALIKQGTLSLNSHFGWTGDFQETGLMGIPLGPLGGIGLAGSYLDYGSFEGRDPSGALTANYAANQEDFQAGWGIRVLKSLLLGAELHFSWENLDNSGYENWAPDLGLIWTPLTDVSLGLDYAAGGGGSSGTQVSTLRSGLSWRTSVDPSVQFLTAFGFSAQSDDYDSFQAACELSFSQSFFLRAGYGAPLQANGGGGFSGLNLGAGLVLADFQLDYAYLPGGDLGDSNVFSLTYGFTVAETPGPKALSAPAAPNSLTVKFDIPPDFLAQGKAMEAQGELQQAILLYQQALAQDPRNVEGWDALGEVEKTLKNLPDARDCFKKALQLNPSDSQAQEGLRDCGP